MQVVVLDKLDYCATLNNLQEVSSSPQFKVGVEAVCQGTAPALLLPAEAGLPGVIRRQNWRRPFSDQLESPQQWQDCPEGPAECCPAACSSSRATYKAVTSSAISWRQRRLTQSCTLQPRCAGIAQEATRLTGLFWSGRMAATLVLSVNDTNVLIATLGA